MIDKIIFLLIFKMLFKEKDIQNLKILDKFSNFIVVKERDC